MKLAALAQALPCARLLGDSHTDVTSLACDSRHVAAGSLFFCIPGTAVDGHEHAPAAVAAGAVAVVCERELALPVAQLVVPSARPAMARLAASFYGDPTRELQVAAVTGTNGKTTTAHLLAAVLAAAGRPSGLLGTVVNRVAGVETPVRLTTAESLELQEMFRRMVDGGDRACVMEASSHALAQRRTDAIDLDAVVFTNLTRDHLDYHTDVDDYYAAKRRLFLPEEMRQPHAAAIVNAGDAHGRRLAGECRPSYGADLWTYALEGEDAVEAADAIAVDVEISTDASGFTLVCPRLDLALPLRVDLPARFNVANATAAALAALVLGVGADKVASGLAGAGGVPGRVEPVRAGQPFAVLVDYAHTPDSLRSVLEAARGLTAGRLICVFGCGGDRDRGKRPLMGAVAASLCDLAVVTSDNPRSEDPAAIIADIRTGIAADAPAEVMVEPDRRAAIALAVTRARAGDAVVVAGKGHETYQVLAGGTIDFDDRIVARQALAAAGWAGDPVSSVAGGPALPGPTPGG